MRLVWAWAPVVALAVLIVVMSSIPADELAAPAIWHYDKLVHAAVYAALAGLLCRALLLGSGGVGRRSRLLMTILAAALAAAFGATDEWHQSFTPGRDASAADFAADVAGAVLGAGLTAVLYRRRARGS